jgi:hypothetical protein
MIRLDVMLSISIRAARILTGGAPKILSGKAGRSVGGGHGYIFRGTRTLKPREIQEIGGISLKIRVFHDNKIGVFLNI